MQIPNSFKIGVVKCAKAPAVFKHMKSIFPEGDTGMRFFSEPFDNKDSDTDVNVCGWHPDLDSIRKTGMKDQVTALGRSFIAGTKS